MPITPRILGYEDAGRLRHVPRGARLPRATRTPSTGRFAGLGMKAGELNLTVMRRCRRRQHRRLRPPRADRASAITPVKGKAILVSGHDLKDLDELLQADRGQGHQRLHARRDAALPRLSGAEEVQASGGQLRRRLAGPDDESSTHSPARS